MRALIRWNFPVAVFLTVALCVMFLVTFDSSTGGYAGRSDARVLANVALLAFFETTSWFLWYRHDQGRVAAASAGLALLPPVIAGLLLPQVTGDAVAGWPRYVLAYLSASHLLWAVTVKPPWPKQISDL